MAETDTRINPFFQSAVPSFEDGNLGFYQLKKTLVGGMRTEYIMSGNYSELIENKQNKFNNSVATPVFRAVIDMAIAFLMHNIFDKVIDEIIDIDLVGQFFRMVYSA